MRIGREIGHTIARANSESLQHRRPAITPIEELGVAPARLTIDHGDLFRINFARAASEFERRERRFHWSQGQRGTVSSSELGARSGRKHRTSKIEAAFIVGG